MGWPRVDDALHTTWIGTQPCYVPPPPKWDIPAFKPPSNAERPVHHPDMLAYPVEFGISDGINYLTARDFAVAIACLDYRLRICQHIYLCLQRTCLTWSLWTDEMKGISFWLGANESLNPEGLWGVSCKQTHTQTHACRPHVCHADPACSASLLRSHERRVSTEWGSSRGRMPGESAAGDDTSSRAAANGRAWQVHAQAGLYGASTGLGWGGGELGLVGGFLST